MNNSPRTIPYLFESSVVRFQSNVMMWEKKKGQYSGTTYKEIQELVHRFAAGLMSLGIQKGDRIALIAEGQNDWVIAELGILYSGAINVPLSVKIEELSDLKFRLAHSGSRMIIASGTQLPKVRQIKNDLPEVEKVIVMETGTERMTTRSPLLLSWKQVRRILPHAMKSLINDGSRCRKAILRIFVTRRALLRIQRESY